VRDVFRDGIRGVVQNSLATMTVDNAAEGFKLLLADCRLEVSGEEHIRAG
jgi:hypothetical protein